MAAVAAAIGLAAFAAPASASPAVWTSSSHPSVSGRTQIFYGAIADRPDDAWAIGYSWGVVGGALEFRTLAQHWNGFSWTTIPTPDYETAPAQDLIFDADAAGPKNIYAAGIRGGDSNAMLMHWNGTAWSLVALPATIPSNADLSSVAVDSTGAWAMGNKYNPLSGYWQPFILHKQGADWVEVQMNATPGCRKTDDGAFYRFDPGGIAIGNDGDLWVTGTCSTDSGDGGVLARYRAGRWRSAFDPGDFDTTSQLNDVYAAPGRRVRAVGGVGTEPLVLARSTGVDFVREPAPTIGRGTSLNAVGAGRRYYAVGVYSGTDAWAHPAAYRLAGGQWRSEQVSEGFGNPQAVDVDPTGQAWLMGVSVSDDAGLTMRREGTP